MSKKGYIEIIDGVRFPRSHKIVRRTSSRNALMYWTLMELWQSLAFDERATIMALEHRGRWPKGDYGRDVSHCRLIDLRRKLRGLELLANVVDFAFPDGYRKVPSTRALLKPRSVRTSALAKH